MAAEDAHGGAGAVEEIVEDGTVVVGSGSSTGDGGDGLPSHDVIDVQDAVENSENSVAEGIADLVTRMDNRRAKGDCIMVLLTTLRHYAGFACHG